MANVCLFLGWLPGLGSPLCPSLLVGMESKEGGCGALGQPWGRALGPPWPDPRPLYAPGLSPAFWPFACPRCGDRTPQGSGALEPPG